MTRNPESTLWNPESKTEKKFLPVLKMPKKFSEKRKFTRSYPRMRFSDEVAKLRSQLQAELPGYRQVEAA